jgi:hypothetical protein
MNRGVFAGRLLEKVLLSARTMVKTGLANDVDAVNQCAELIFPRRANG